MLVALGLLDIATRARQAAISTTWRTPVVPPVVLPTGTPGGRRLVRWRPIRVVLIVFLMVGALAAGWRYLLDAAAIAEFHGHAQQLSGTIVLITDDDFTATVALDGQTVDVEMHRLWRVVGETVDVLLDPESGRVEYLDDQYDPAAGLWGAVGGVVAAGLLVVSEVLRRRANQRLFTVGGQPFSVAATYTGLVNGGIVLATFEDLGHPFAMLPWTVEPSPTSDRYRARSVAPRRCRMLSPITTP